MQRPSLSHLHAVVLPIGGLVALVLAVLFGLLWHGAKVQDEIARERSIELVGQIVEDGIEQISLQAKDYGWWNDTVRHVVNELDPVWADNNIGAWIHDVFGYEFSFVVDQDGSTIYASIDGERVDTDAFARLGGGLADLVRRARAAGDGVVEPDAVGGLISAAGEPVVSGAILVMPESPGDVEVADGRSAVLIFAKRLDDAFWESFGSRYMLDNMRVLPAGSHGVMLPLESVEGQPLGGLAWRTHRPGSANFGSTLPAISVATLVVVVVTVMVLRRASRALVESEARFRDVADATSDWIWETDAAGRLVFLSEPFAKATSLAADDLLGQPLHTLFEAPEDDEESLDALLGEGEPFRNRIFHQRAPDGTVRTVRLAGTPVDRRVVGSSGHRGTATDVTREVEAERQVRFLALHDSLTGLANRTSLRERLDRAIREAARRDEIAAVICIDLDRFKSINDTLGHAAGDLLLKAVADRLRATVREVDTVARLSGDEFAIVQTGIASSEAVATLCDRLLEVLAEPCDLDGQEVMVSGSIGVALAPNDGRDPSRLLQNADIALYRAKEEGRNDVRFFEPAMDARIRERKEVEQALRAGLTRDEFELHYQPQFAVDDDRITAVEALLRWRHPTEGLLSPDRFIDVAEESGLMLQLGEWVLRETCRMAADWPDVVVSVNLSPVQFRHRDLVETVRRAITDHGLDPHRLELEITERVLIECTESAYSALEALQSLGVRISMDDFGTGYSSLNHLQRFPFDKLKIDRSFVQAMGVRPDSAAIVRAVVSLGKSLRLRTCAEGVETAEQLDFLTREGCDEIQGFYYSQPLRSDALSALLANRARAEATRTETVDGT